MNHRASCQFQRSCPAAHTDHLLAFDSSQVATPAFSYVTSNFYANKNSFLLKLTGAWVSGGFRSDGARRRIVSDRCVTRVLHVCKCVFLWHYRAINSGEQLHRELKQTTDSDKCQSRTHRQCCRQSRTHENVGSRAG